MASPGTHAPDRGEALLAILTDLSIDHRCFKLATSLRAQGYRPVIYCDKPLHAPGPAWDAFDVRVITLRSHLTGYFPVFAEFLLRLLPALLTTRAKVWVSLDAPPLFWLALWGRMRGRAVTYDSHELYLETPMVLNRRSRRWFWTAWENAGFALIRRAITVSPAILARLRARHPHVRFKLLPNMPLRGESRVADRAPLPEGPSRLVYQGGLRAHSGLPELFEALATRPRYTLDVYGGGPEDAALRAAARAAGVQGRVTFHGSIPFEELPEAMRPQHLGAHLMQPSSGSFALTWANKIFDYAHALLPTLLADNPAHRALLAEHGVGVLADSRSPASIGEALDRLAAGYPEHLEACRRARAAWCWEAYADGLPELLES